MRDRQKKELLRLAKLLFQDTETAKDWISTPNMLWGGMSPESMIDYDRGKEVLEWIKTRF